ncbi:MAG TPA: aspartyl/asparaginyl beta-hydroxylase domain-containing protein [Steroidobacteraceae bacterium]|jgi:aspartyl/asparaginyl beta-hydroxylase (cupin superfamily)|nr:aspartyl/asparaginyl beta-hydroxylase domain-containing protein [Steroidobacteraceae bacterium]
MADPRAGELANAAVHAASTGNFAEAERLWRELLRLDPRNSKALFSLGVHALQRGDLKSAHDLLAAARAVAPNDLLVLLTLGTAHRLRGDANAEREAIEAALAVDAYYIPALLARAAWFERAGNPKAAAQNYANSLKIAPPASHWPASLREQLEHARAVVDQYSAERLKHIADKVADLQAGLPSAVQARWKEAASIVAGRARPYFSECNQLHVPRLPAIPFFEREHFPWLAAMESKTAAIRDELAAALTAERDKFNPYIAYRPGDPVNQWKELNHSHRWSAYHLWRGGEPQPGNLARCPQTAAALADAQMAEIAGLCPNAMFSALAPHTTIPPHNGETNARVVAHLPLIVPDGCIYRVGADQRRWNVGEILVFDDTIEHEARNDSDELRVVLIFDLWNPLLSVAERAMVQALVAAARSFGAA